MTEDPRKERRVVRPPVLWPPRVVPAAHAVGADEVGADEVGAGEVAGVVGVTWRSVVDHHALYKLPAAVGTGPLRWHRAAIEAWIEDYRIVPSRSKPGSAR